MRVVFKRGGSVRGAVVALNAGTSVVLLPDGETEQRTIPWDEVARVDHLDAAGQVVAAGAPSGKTPSAAAFDATLGPRLHVKSTSEGVGLYRVNLANLDDTVPHGDLVCDAPCDKQIGEGIGKLYFFGGPGLSSSGRFELESHGNFVDAHVNAGSRTAKTAGIVFISIGGGAGLTAIGLAVYGAAINGAPPTRIGNASETLNAGGLLEAAGVIGGIGGAMLLGGLIAFGSGVTTYDLYERAPPVTALPAPSGFHVSGSF